MKKALLLTLALSCAAAQALTVNWTEGGTTTTTSSIGAHSVAFGTPISLTIAFNALASGNADLFAMRTDDQSKGIRIRQEGENLRLYVKDNDDASWGYYTFNTSGAGDYSAISLVLTADTIKLYAEERSGGMLIINSSRNDFSATGGASFENWFVANVVTELTVDVGTAWSDEQMIKAVPEPTALALLALGVAGLALKRKVA